MKTVKTTLEKLQKRLEVGKMNVLDPQPITKMFDEQMELNFVVFKDELRHNVENFLLIASIILHQPLIDFDYINEIIESIKIIVK